MKKNYKNFTEFKNDLSIESNTQEILYLLGVTSQTGVRMIRSPFRKDGHERTPSMQIAGENEGLWFRDYGDSTYKGDIFTFVQLYYNCTFYEAIAKITELFDVTIDEDAFKNVRKMSEIQKKLQREWEIYRKEYKECKDIDAVKAQATRLFPAEVGYSKSEERIVIPFYDKHGNVVRFSKRAIHDDQKPKWKHTNVLEDLTATVAGYYNFAAIDQYDDVVLVEGPGDAIGVQRAGFPNVAAQCGVGSFSKAQIDALTVNNVKSVTFLYDPDEAGKKGTLRSCFTLCKHAPILAANSYVAFLKGPKDCGECDKSDIKDALDNKISIFDYIVDSGNFAELKKAYNITPNHLKDAIWGEIINCYAKKNKVTPQSVISSFTKPVKNTSKMSERQCRLLATAMHPDYSDKYEIFENMSVAQAKKELKIRYKMEV